MAKYLLLYTGGRPPADAAEGEKVMGAWMAWFGKLGDRIVDGGAPLGDRRAVSGAAASGVGGYSIINAANLDEAVALTNGHPHLAVGGAIEVLETQPISM
jgi:hypothetical protein